MAWPHNMAEPATATIRGGSSLQLRSENTVAEFGYNWAVEAIIKLALDEDIGRGDITTESTVPAENQATAVILQKAPGVLCGMPVVRAVFAILDPRVEVEVMA